jgi:hypothetical protein
MQAFGGLSNECEVIPYQMRIGLLTIKSTAPRLSILLLPCCHNYIYVSSLDLIIYIS